MKKFIIGFLVLVLSVTIYSQPISPNGFSGLGLLPSATTITKSKAEITFDSTVPGAPVTSGYNTQIGFGLTDEIELVGRLATNNQKCNMFANGECPANTYRDFSSSIKWAPSINWLKRNNASVAFGATDFGGAATYFRSYYVVGSKTFKEFEISAGQSLAKVPTSMLNGTFASLAWRPANWLNLSMQRVGPLTTAHALLQTPVTNNDVSAWVTLNRRLSDAVAVDKSWIGIGVSLPLNVANTNPEYKEPRQANTHIKQKDLSQLLPTDLEASLRGKGFYKVKLGEKNDGSLNIELENTTYIWNNLDAAGVALGEIASAYGQQNSEKDFELTITSRGIKQIKLNGEASCVGRWLSKGEPCKKLSVKSLLQRQTYTGLQDRQIWEKTQENLEGALGWNEKESFHFRPEIVVSPAIISAVGTEYGAFDFDIGANINLVIPLWTGATLDTNRLEPLGLGTRQFELGGVFYGARVKGDTNRRMFHQLINLQAINTQARLSTGTAYSTWDGRQIETSTQTDSGRHKFGVTAGKFIKDDFDNRLEKKYQLLNYRLINNDQQTATTEITKGKFWGGDKGFSVNQRFWYGDTTLNVYFRRTRMGDGQPLVSFAGLQFAIPFTPRQNKSLEHLGIRGVSQWTYSLETKILEKDNIITGGYGEVPRMGESLVTTFNRDRNSTRYYDTNLSRIRDAYLYLGNN